MNLSTFNKLFKQCDKLLILELVLFGIIVIVIYFTAYLFYF